MTFRACRLGPPGGTALRILYNLRRFSEDLDFSLINKKNYNFLEINAALLSGLKLYGLSVESKLKTEGNVQSAFLKFSGLLKELGLSALKDQKLSIRIEIDANPPVGWHTQTTIINKAYMFGITHFDLPSLYATKLHACFYRRFTKGRDFYDFIWYLSQKIKPNFTLLNNAIKQTSGAKISANERNFKDFLLKNVEKIDFKAVKKDVERFLEDKAELRLLELKTIKQSIEAAY